MAAQDLGCAAAPDVAEKNHQFYAIAFEENLPLKQLSLVFVPTKLSPHELYQVVEPVGGLYIYPFRAVVFVRVVDQSVAVLFLQLHVISVQARRIVIKTPRDATAHRPR